MKKVITIVKMMTFILWTLVMEFLFYTQLRWYLVPFDAVPVNTYLIGWGVYTAAMIGMAWMLLFCIEWRETIKIQNSY